MPPDAYGWGLTYGYSVNGPTPGAAISVVTMVEMVIACLLPLLLVAAAVGFEAWSSSSDRQRRTTRLSRREQRLLIGLDRDVSRSDPWLAHMLATMTLDEGVRP